MAQTDNRCSNKAMLRTDCDGFGLKISSTTNKVQKGPCRFPVRPQKKLRKPRAKNTDSFKILADIPPHTHIGPPHLRLPVNRSYPANGLAPLTLAARAGRRLLEDDTSLANDDTGDSRPSSSAAAVDGTGTRGPRRDATGKWGRVEARIRRFSIVMSSGSRLGSHIDGHHIRETPRPVTAFHGSSMDAVRRDASFTAQARE